MTILEQYGEHFLPAYSNYPQGRYASIFLLRQTESEAIFRTEGRGEPLSKAFVHPGLSRNGEPVQRVVISKRKQTAVERRTGRELLRSHDLLFVGAGQEGVCALNRNNPCGKCMDCMLYGYAAGGRGAQKSRVVSDDAFSLHPAPTVAATRHFNTLFDNGTTRDPESGESSTSMGTDEYVKPETIFLDIETVRDTTVAEFQYVLGNILRSARYGAIASRIGKVRNHVVALIFSDCEMFSNLEWTQATYDRLRDGRAEPDFPLHVEAVRQAARATIRELTPRVVGQTTPLPQDDLDALLADMRDLYTDPAAVREMLGMASAMYPRG